MIINNIVRNKKVTMVKGDYKGKIGIWKGITGYKDGYGVVCKIIIENNEHEFTSDFFEFVNNEIQEKWNDDNYSFKIDN